jgi:VWFA-related protein
MRRASALGFFIILSFPLLVAPGWAPVSAQKKPNPDQDALQHEVTVTVKLVQVYVTDPKGNPARDLEMSDFLLYDNRKLQTITGFEKHFLAAPEAAPEVLVRETKPLPSWDTSSLMNRKFIFLIDGERNDVEGLALSRKAALQFMDDQIQPTDEICLMSYSPSQGMVLHEYFTTDHPKLRQAVQAVKITPGISPDRTKSVLEPEPAARDAMGMELLSAQVFGPHSHAPRPGGTRAFIFSLTDLAKAFRQIPGQKNIILFTKGFGRSILNLGSTDKPFFVSMSQELASANVPVFAVNTTTHDDLLYYFGERGIEKGIILPPEPSLEYISEQTGGKYFDDATYSAGISQTIQNATSNYYVLGYSIASTWDGKFHEIKVEVKRPGYQVHAQGGYFNPRPFNTLSPIEKHLQLLGLALGEKAYFGQHLNFPMIALPYSDKREANTLLLSEIPVQSIRESVGDNTEFISLVFDENRTIVDSKRIEMNWGTVKGERMCQYSAAALAPGRYDCRVVIRNLDNGKAAVGACSVEIPGAPAAAVSTPSEAKPAEIRIFPPLLLVADKGTQYLNVSAQDKAAKQISLSQVFPFPPEEFAPLVGGLEQGVESLCAAVRCAWTDAQVASAQPEVQFSAWIIPEGRAQKTDLTVDVSSAADRDNVRFFLLEFELPELKPGDYRLHVRAENADTNIISEASSAFSVVPAAGQNR